MSKLPIHHQFWDLSDYSRPVAKWLVQWLLPTSVGAKTLTLAFTMVGLLAAWLIYTRQYVMVAGGLLLVKSMIDAADGEMARMRNQPSYVGRYLDSISDFLLNGLLLFAIGYPLSVPVVTIIITWGCIQFQGTVYNYYYVIKRHQANGDTTSRILEFSRPDPLPSDHPMVLTCLHGLYVVLYGWLDWLLCRLDRQAINTPLSNGFMTAVSLMGLGTQLLVMAVLIWVGQMIWIIPFFLVVYTALACGIIIVRRVFV